MRSQINRAISSALSDKVIPEIHNIVSSMSSSGNSDTEDCSFPNSQENEEETNGLKTKIARLCDLRNIEVKDPYRLPRLVPGFKISLDPICGDVEVC